MVSTQASQYITDFTPVPAEPGKSPLALLAKTCETIGLPEGSSKKSSSSSSSSSPQEKKEMHHHRSLVDQQQSSSKQSSKSSPRSTPQSKEPTLTFPGLPKPQFAMGMPPMGFNPFFNPMAMAAHYQMPMGFPGAFPMGPAGFAMGAANRMPCPFAMMRQPCANPACLQCPSSSNAVKTGQMSSEMMAQFAAHPLFSMYAGMMPNMAGVPTSSYQALLAASASAAASAASATSPTDYSMSKPSTSTPSTSEVKPTTTSRATPPAKPQLKASSPKARFQCNWVDSDVACGKVFEEESELTNHVKKMHAPSPSSSSTSSEPSTSTGKAPRSATATPQRFNPYGKPQALPTMVPQMAMNMNPLVLPFSLQAMYSSRLMPTVVTHQ